jgi:hypothetical protein
VVNVKGFSESSLQPVQDTSHIAQLQGCGEQDFIWQPRFSPVSRAAQDGTGGTWSRKEGVSRYLGFLIAQREARDWADLNRLCLECLPNPPRSLPDVILSLKPFLTIPFTTATRGPFSTAQLSSFFSP